VATEGLGHRKMLKDPGFIARVLVTLFAQRPQLLKRALRRPGNAPSIASLQNEETSHGDVRLDRKAAAVLQQGGVIAPDERLPWPQTGGDGRAARHRDVRRHGAGAHPHGLRSQHRHPHERRRHADLLPDHRRQGAQLPGLQLRLHRRGDRGHGLCRQGPNGNIGVALGGIIACGIVYAIIGAIVHAVGTAGSSASCRRW
jgi:hypothetical protein